MILRSISETAKTKAVPSARERFYTPHKKITYSNTNYVRYRSVGNIRPANYR